jgi:WD40 repeat protein
MKHLILTILFALSLFAQEIGVPFALLPRGDVKTTALVSSKDGKTIFSGSNAGGIYRIELNPIKVTFGVKVGIDSREIVTYINGEKIIGSISKGTTVNHIALSPDEHIVVTCGSDKLLKTWDAQSGKLLQTFIGHNSPVKSAVILSDNKTLISGDENMTIKYWDIPSGKEIKSFAVNAKAGECNNDPEILHNLYLGGNGKILIVYDSYRVGFVDVETGKVMNEYRHKSPFYANKSYFHNDILYVLMDMFVLEYAVGNYKHMIAPNTVNIDPKKNFKREQESAILNSCITDENDILTILEHSRDANNEDDLKYTSPPLVIGKVKVYGANYGRIIIDQCPMDNNQIMIKPMKKNNWLAITSDGYFNMSEDVLSTARDYLYIKNELGKVAPIDEATYNKYHKTLTVEEK